MNTIDYKNLLLKTAVAAISCDGDIDDREIEELKNIEKSSAYFSSEDLSKTLEKSLSKKTKVIFAVHTLGFPCDMVKINEIAKGYFCDNSDTE